MNTRAERMSLLGDDPSHFVRWNRARADRGTFSAQTSTEVLATGHASPSDPLARWLPAGEPRYVRDPWRTLELAAIGSDDRVLLLGTGLTMIDVVLTLLGHSHRGAITAVSRRGLLPRAHGGAHEQLPQDVADEPRRGLALGNLRRALRAVRGAAAAAEERSLHWQTVVDALRTSTETLWGALCAADRRRFVQHVRPYWDVHRHRLPHERRDDATAHYDWIVNCTGPSFANGFVM